MSLVVEASRLLADLRGIDEAAADRVATWSVTLDQWSRAQRLVGWRSAHLLLSEGIGDAWEAVPLLRQTTGPVVDLGSGCGLPALICAAALPDRRFHLVEARRKRVAFLRAAVRAMKLAEVTVHHARTEDFDPPTAPVVTARAFKPPAEVLLAATRLKARSVLLSVAPPAPTSDVWKARATRPGRPRDRRLHVLYEPSPP